MPEGSGGIDESTITWTTEPTPGTWYVSDEALNWNGDIVTGFRNDLDWITTPTEAAPTYGIYMEKLMLRRNDQNCF